MQTNTSKTNKRIVFVLMPLIFMCSFYGAISSGSQEALGLAVYINILLLICLSPVVLVKDFKSPLSILIVMTSFYFMMFALEDLNNLLFNNDMISRYRGDFITSAEVVIILGIVSLISAYFLTLFFVPSNFKGVMKKEWKPLPTMVVAVIFWLIGLYINYMFQFEFLQTRGIGIGTGSDNAPTLSTNLGGIYTLFRNLQPFGALLLIYLAIINKNKTAILFLCVIVIVDFVFGFFADSKELSIRTPILIVLSLMFLRNKIPYTAILIMLVVVGLTWTMFMTYRFEVLQLGAQSRKEAASAYSENISSLVSSSDIGNIGGGLEGFVDRISLKANVELVVRNVGKSVKYQDGYTLSILLYAFIPRFLVPDKPSTSIGQLFNREFKISEDPDTYISTSHVGELYWNYGYFGVVIGMFLIGIVLALFAVCFRMDRLPSIAKYTLLLAVIYLVCLRFEGGLGQQYTLWFRVLVAFSLLHLIMPKKQTVTSNDPSDMVLPR